MEPMEAVDAWHASNWWRPWSEISRQITADLAEEQRVDELDGLPDFDPTDYGDNCAYAQQEAREAAALKAAEAAKAQEAATLKATEAAKAQEAANLKAAEAAKAQEAATTKAAATEATARGKKRNRETDLH